MGRAFTPSPCILQTISNTKEQDILGGRIPNNTSNPQVGSSNPSGEHYHIPHNEKILVMKHLGKYGYVEKKKFDADMLVELKE